MSDFTSITTSSSANFTRGTIIAIYGDGIRGRDMRVTRATDTSFTLRDLHRWAWVESLRFAWERYVQWPTRDAIAYLRRLLPPEAP